MTQNIKSFIKNISRQEPEKTLYKAKFIDDNDCLTEMGQEALNVVLYEKYKEDMKKIALQVIEVDEADKKTNNGKN